MNVTVPINLIPTDQAPAVASRKVASFKPDLLQSERVLR